MFDNISDVVTWRRWFRLLEKLWLFCKHCTLPSCFTVFRVWSISTQRNTLCVCGKAGNMKAAGIVDRKDFAGWSEIPEFGPPPWSQSTGGVKAERKCLSISSPRFFFVCLFFCTKFAKSDMSLCRKQLQCNRSEQRWQHQPSTQSEAGWADRCRSSTWSNYRAELPACRLGVGETGGLTHNSTARTVWRRHNTIWRRSLRPLVFTNWVRK